MILFLTSLILAAVFFIGGFFCGSVALRNRPTISVVLPVSALAEPIGSLQRTIYRFNQQLGQHGQRMARRVDEIKATGLTPPQLRQFGKLLSANQDFEKQLSAFAADVQTVECGLEALRSAPEGAQAGATAETLIAEAAPNVDGPAANVLSQADRRTELRHPFNCRQWIAPYSGARVPEPEEFFRVQCCDISSGGVSFFLDRGPTYEMIVIRLAGPLEPRYLTARIQRTSPSGGSEHGRYLVGCRFLGTLHRSALPAGLEGSIERRERRSSADVVAIA